MSKPRPTPNVHNTIYLDELILLAAPTIVFLVAANLFVSAPNLMMMLLDGIILVVVPPLTFRLVKPHLRATKARHLTKGESA